MTPEEKFYFSENCHFIEVPAACMGKSHHPRKQTGSPHQTVPCINFLSTSTGDHSTEDRYHISALLNIPRPLPITAKQLPPTTFLLKRSSSPSTQFKADLFLSLRLSIVDSLTSQTSGNDYLRHAYHYTTPAREHRCVRR